MKVRWKIVAVVFPLLLVTIGLTGISAVLSSTTGITRIAQDFLDFKTSELQKHAESQWRLLVDNGFTSRPDMLSATQSGILSFAESILRTDTELIIAFDENGELMGTTNQDILPTTEEKQALKNIFEQRDTALVNLQIGGADRVGKGMYFAPFSWFYMVTESRDTFYREITAIVRNSIIILVAALIISVVFLLFFSSQITQPMVAIVKSMRKIIESNDMTERVPIEYKDETGVLAHTFNIMLGELDKAYTQIKSFAFQAVLAKKTEAKIRNIFQKYVPQDLINKFFENPDSMLVGESRTLAILFSDIRSFTSISEAMSPDDLVNLLNRYFTLVVEIIMEHQGIVDKYIGDAIMAFFGAPVQHDDDAYQSVLVGVEMSEAITMFNEKQKKRGTPMLKTGIGINWGEVTVGNIGSEKKMDYTVIGDAVNLASRLEGLTKQYAQQLIVSESLLPFIKERFALRVLDTVAVKGKSKGVKIYSVKRNLRDVEQKIWDLHNKSMGYYYQRDFQTAIEGFQKIISIDNNDTNANILLKRSQQLLQSPPPKNWDGVEVLTKK